MNDKPPAALVKYEAQAPVKNPATLKSLLEQSRESIASLLPQHVTPDRLIRLMLVAANRNPKILGATQSSVIETVMRAAELGLDFGQLGGAHAVPYGSKLQLLIDYRGLVKLIRQSGELEHVEADVVYEHDSFLFRKGDQPKVEFIPKLTGTRGSRIGAYAVIRTKGGLYCDFMDVDAIERIRSRSRAAKDGPWVTDWDEMAKKTVLRRCSKLAPMSSEKLEAAFDYDNATFELPALDDPAMKTVSPRPGNGPTAPQSIGEVFETLAELPSAVPEEEPELLAEPIEPPQDAPTEPPAPRRAPKSPKPKAEPEPDSGEQASLQETDRPESGQEDRFVVPLKDLIAAAEKVFGPLGMRSVKFFAKQKLGVDDLSSMTEEQFLEVDSFIAETARQQ